jgi:hypothetical protein
MTRNPQGVPHGCGPAALAESTHATHRRVWVADVERLVGAGVRYPEIARQLGVKPASLYRALLRKGRLDLWVAAGGSRQLGRRKRAGGAAGSPPPPPPPPCDAGALGSVDELRVWLAGAQQAAAKIAASEPRPEVRAAWKARAVTLAEVSRRVAGLPSDEAVGA